MDFINNFEENMKKLVMKIPFVKRTVNYIYSIPTHMDFEGQKKAEVLYQVIIALFGAVGFVYGFVVEQFSQAVLFLFIGSIISCILVLPPWPFYRRNPLEWQKVEKKEAEEKTKSSKQKDAKKKKVQ
eukprot:gene3952-4497_t